MAKSFFANKRTGSGLWRWLGLVALVGLVVAIWRVGFCVPEPGDGGAGVEDVSESAAPGGGLERGESAVDEARDGEVDARTAMEMANETVAEDMAVVVGGSEAVGAAAGVGGGVVERRDDLEHDAGRARELFQRGRQAMAEEDYIGARSLLSQAVALGLDEGAEKAARELLNAAADKWLFSPGVFAGDVYCENHQVKSGELLSTIGKRYKVPYELLMRINGIKDARKVAAGRRIKVVRGPFHLVVERKRFLMSVYLGDVLVRSRSVGLGSAGRGTPTGLWRAEAGKKQVNPEWTDPDSGEHYYPDDPENPLGERWVGLEGLEGNAKGRSGFGIHGTIKPDEIGRGASRGCIRLHNGDMAELFDLVTAGLSEVRVLP